MKVALELTFLSTSIMSTKAYVHQNTSVGSGTSNIKSRGIPPL